MWEVDFYRTNDDIAPVEEFLDSLDSKMRAKAIHELNILQEFGPTLREPHSKPIENGKSTYTLSDEEQKAIERAINSTKSGR